MAQTSDDPGNAPAQGDGIRSEPPGQARGASERPTAANDAAAGRTGDEAAAARTANDAAAGRTADNDAAAPAEARQRWRIIYARGEVKPELVGRAGVDAWFEAVRSSRLPAASSLTDPVRPRLAFAAPLPAGARGERELVDLWLTDRIARWQLREALAGRLPVAHEWVDAEDVWLAAPALAGQVAAADWRIELEPDGLPTDASQRLEPAARQLLASRTIERTRVKGGNERRYDLRPLVDSIGIEPGAATVISVRTRFDPERGAGRPEEVIAALGEEAGIALIPATMSRLRLLLTVDLDRSR